MSWNAAVFMETLPLMANGMAGIFLVTAVLILSMYLLRLFRDRKER